MIRDTTKPVIHFSTEAPLWDPNFLLPGRNCFALRSCPCIIIFPVLSLLFLSFYCNFTQQYRYLASLPRLTSRCVLLSSIWSLLLSLTTAARPIYSRCRLIPEKVSATAQTNHSNAARYTVTCKYVQSTQRETEGAHTNSLLSIHTWGDEQSQEIISSSPRWAFNLHS